MQQIMTPEQRNLIEKVLDDSRKSVWEPMEALKAITDLRVVGYALLKMFDELADTFVPESDK